MHPKASNNLQAIIHVTALFLKANFRTLQSAAGYNSLTRAPFGGGGLAGHPPAPSYNEHPTPK